MMKAGILLLSVFLPSVLTLPLKSRGTFKRLIVFGDSFSDNGNGAWIISKHQWPVDPAYYNHSFSNGPKWNEVASQDLGLELVNVAVGGSTADNDFVAGGTGPSSTIKVPSSKQQIQMFLSNDAFEPTDVVVHWTGANDALFQPNITGSQLTSVVTANVDLLFRNGVKNLLLPTYFPLNKFPAILGDPEYDGLGEFTTNYIGGINNIIAAYSAFIDIRIVNSGALIENMFEEPDKYGIDPAYVDPPTACLTGVYSAEGVPRNLCEDPEKHLFFDTYHPVKEVHERLGKLFEEVINQM